MVETFSAAPEAAGFPGEPEARRHCSSVPTECPPLSGRVDCPRPILCGSGHISLLVKVSPLRVTTTKGINLVGFQSEMTSWVLDP